ncbi:JAB domain-containing protein, partial [bacterium]|nr:JAB domain-containing protein [bacterium]
KKSEDVASYYIPLIGTLKKEVFKVALLDGANKLIRDITVSEGTLNTSVVHPREVFRDALIEATAGVVLIHNHPSSNPMPSKDDIKITKQLIEAGKIFGIKVFDHIIVTRDSYRSFADEGLM